MTPIRSWFRKSRRSLPSCLVPLILGAVLLGYVAPRFWTSWTGVKDAAKTDEMDPDWPPEFRQRVESGIRMAWDEFYRWSLALGFAILLLVAGMYLFMKGVAKPSRRPRPSRPKR